MLALLSAALSFTLETSGSRERLRLELDASSCTAGCDGPACAPDAGCDGKALMHAGAELKNYVESFHFRAPSDASGDLVVRALVKQGETNRGAAAGPLALS